jgi:hypothetical protein
MKVISDYRSRLAYRAGKKAREQGKPATANNRERGTVYYDDWWAGWNDEDNRIYFGEAKPA